MLLKRVAQRQKRPFKSSSYSDRQIAVHSLVSQSSQMEIENGMSTIQIALLYAIHNNQQPPTIPTDINTQTLTHSRHWVNLKANYQQAVRKSP